MSAAGRSVTTFLRATRAGDTSALCASANHSPGWVLHAAPHPFPRHSSRAYITRVHAPPVVPCQRSLPDSVSLPICACPRFIQARRPRASFEAQGGDGGPHGEGAGSADVIEEARRRKIERCRGANRHTHEHWRRRQPNFKSDEHVATKTILMEGGREELQQRQQRRRRRVRVVVRRRGGACTGEGRRGQPHDDNAAGWCPQHSYWCPQHHHHDSSYEQEK